MIKNLFSLLVLFLLLTSCSKKYFYVSKEAFDPLTVYAYKPLSLPPIYYLSSQEIADERRFIKEGQARVQEILIESADSVSSQFAMIQKEDNIKIIGSDLKLLKLANANKDLSKVRERLDQESLSVINKEPTFIDKIFKDYEGDKLDDKLSEYKKYNIH